MMTYEMNGQFRETAIDAHALMSCSSRHGFVRTMERTGATDRQALRMIRNAWERGKRAEQLPYPQQRSYVARYDSMLLDGRTNLRVYGNYLFIFTAGGRLITMHQLPQTFSRKRVYDGKTRVRDVKKYSRFNDEREAAEPDVAP
ncbi:MAG: hypothetical protein ACI4O7_02480 [Aristaeellaceae bacterium]